MKPIQVFLESDIHTDLKLLAIKEGTTVSELIRDLIMGMVGTPQNISPPTKKEESLKKIRPTVGECKSGHILNKFGKCSQKGCKYA